MQMILNYWKDIKGDIIRIDRLIEFLPTEHWSWDKTGEIRDIEIDNECSGNFIFHNQLL